MNRQNNSLRHLLPAVGALLLAACASIGHPDGGPRDTTPPCFVESDPMPGTLNFDGNKIQITFDENIQLDDPSNKVVMSPPPAQMPQITSNGRKVSITLRDTLLPNTTYTIDLANSVKDLNEGNILDGLAIDFSTGAERDSLQISGIVLEARTLEPAQSMLVGVYKDDVDSCISTTRLHRIAKTNKSGEFTVRNLPEGTYGVYALNDLSRDYRWDRSEDVAFLGYNVSPSCERIDTTTTVRTRAGNDSTVSVTKFITHPNDLLLCWFNEGYKAQYLQDYKRPTANTISIIMAAPADSLPQLTAIRANSDRTRRPFSQAALMSRNATADTIRYWLTDSALIKADTLLVETRYRRVDSLEHLVWRTDTLKFNFRSTPKKTAEAPRKPRTREGADSLQRAPRRPTMAIAFEVEGKQHLHQPFGFRVTDPLRSVDSSRITLQLLTDSIWGDVSPQPRIHQTDSINLLHYSVDHPWLSARRYRLIVDSAAVTNVYGLDNDSIAQEFETYGKDDYSNIQLTLSNLPDSAVAIVELLSSSEKVLATAPTHGNSAQFNYVLPGTYYLRLFIDSDGDGLYTSGHLSGGLRRQPEEVYYFPKKLTVKKNWDIQQQWNITELPVDQQKPMDIRKNKPDKKAGEQEPADEDDEDEDESAFSRGLTTSRRK
jgi:hypothetical protein